MKENFSGFFGDFGTFFHDSDLNEYDVYLYLGETPPAYRQRARIIGMIDGDYAVNLLIYVPLDETEVDEETDSLVEKHGVSIISLQSALKYGIRVIPHETENN